MTPDAPAVGDSAPAFELPSTEGETHSSAGGDVTVLVFTCNHCPYAIAWHDRLVAAAQDYGDRVRFLAINPNDGERYPADSLEAMQERVAADGGWPMAYLHDESQQVARDYGARTTPDVFVLDGAGTIRYRGAPDGDHSDPAKNAEWLRAALDAVLAGHEVELAETEPVGCSIKWRP